MNRISILKNPIQEYAWGSRTTIQELLGEPGSEGRPMAELWMGAHPEAPSRVLTDGEWKSLGEVIEGNPELVLGKGVAGKFSNRLPFLFKVLAAERPLSVQVHPNFEQARAGFFRENSLGIPLNAPDRNYRDENHKPEILCALTTFQALKGFREIEEILGLMDKVSSLALSKELDRLRNMPDIHGLRYFFTALMSMDEAQQKAMAGEAVSQAKKRVDEDRAFYWMVELGREYPGDIGIFSPVILNLVQLEPGEAISLQAGELHAYLHGSGIELMANSDNVIRGGLTTKHMDVPELLRIVNFRTDSAPIVKSISHGACQKIYETPAEEFLLSVIYVDKNNFFTSPHDRSIEIMICLKGEADINDLGTGEVLSVTRGDSLIVPPVVSQYRIEGNATFYRASVPL
jgi:mannose-6-phosphate isomerase